MSRFLGWGLLSVVIALLSLNGWAIWRYLHAATVLEAEVLIMVVPSVSLTAFVLAIILLILLAVAWERLDVWERCAWMGGSLASVFFIVGFAVWDIFW